VIQQILKAIRGLKNMSPLIPLIVSFGPKQNQRLTLSACDMAKKERKQYERNRSKNLPAFKSVDELVAFFETHDLGDYWEKLPEAEVEAGSKKRISTGNSKWTSSKTKTKPRSRDQSSFYRQKK